MLTEAFYEECHRVVIRAMRARLLEFPPLEKEKRATRKEAGSGICKRCQVSFQKNIAMQQYCTCCSEAMRKERDKARRERVKFQNRNSKLKIENRN